MSRLQNTLLHPDCPDCDICPQCLPNEIGDWRNRDTLNITLLEAGNFSLVGSGVCAGLSIPFTEMEGTYVLQNKSGPPNNSLFGLRRFQTVNDIVVSECPIFCDTYASIKRLDCITGNPFTESFVHLLLEITVIYATIENPQKSILVFMRVFNAFGQSFFSPLVPTNDFTSDCIINPYGQFTTTFPPQGLWFREFRIDGNRFRRSADSSVYQWLR